MTDALGDLLRDYQLDIPPEIARIKEYLFKKFEVDADISVQNNQIIIAVASGALAGTLRMHTVDLQKAAQTDKRLVIRIGR